MDVYNPIFRITWPGPGVTGISIVLGMLFIALAVYILILYLKAKERERLYNYQLFLFQVKRKGLNNFQIKILNNMASYMKHIKPTTLVANAALFEGMLANFTEYLQKSRENSSERMGICLDLLKIYEKLYVRSSYREKLTSMAELDDGQILHVSAESGEGYIGKISGRGKNFLAIQLFTNLKNIKIFETEQPLEIYVIRINDAEYKIRTKCIGVEGNRILAAHSEELSVEKEYRHPYISVVLPAVIEQMTGEDEPEFDGTIYRINELECELRTETEMLFDRTYTLSFDISDYAFKAVSKVISLRTVEHEKVYYVTLKFQNMSKPAAAVLSNFITENL